MTILRQTSNARGAHPRLSTEANRRGITPRLGLPQCRLVRLALLLGLTLCSTLPAQAQPDWYEGMDSAMYEDPHFQFHDVEMRFSPDAVPLWILALKSPEADLRRQAAATITWSHRLGMRELQDVIPPLIQNLADGNHDVVRLSSAEALVTLDASEAAATLFELSQTGRLDLAQVIEPALGRWGFAPMLDLWRERLTDQRIDRRRMTMAIRGLGAAGDAPSALDLRRIAVDAARSPDLRLAAGESLGNICGEGLEQAAAELMGRDTQAGPLEPLVAAHLLSQHSAPAARDLLIELAQNDQSCVAAIALRRLVELDPDLVLPCAADCLRRGDANVRHIVAQALIARPSGESIVMLGDLLNDPIPDVRIFVRRSLVTLAEADDLREPIITQGKRMLALEQWQAQEQSMKLLVHLNDRSNTNRFLELLEKPRREVYVTAAWALRKSAVDETLEPLLEFAKARNAKRVELMLQDAYRDGLDEQLTQILQFFGQKNYEPALPLLLTFVPKNFEVSEARGAAVWSLGYLYEGKPDPALVRQLQERIRDTLDMVPELNVVRRFSAITLGRMKASDALPVLEQFNEPRGIESTVGYACAWAIREITGREFEPPGHAFRYYTNFFLEPLRTDRK